MTTDALIQLIKDKKSLSYDNIDSVARVLLTALLTSEEQAFCQNWLLSQPFDMVSALYNHKDVKPILAKSSVYEKKANPVLFDKAFQTTLLPKKIKEWLKTNISFSVIQFPSGISLFVDEEYFFNTLSRNIEKYPSLIDDLRYISRHTKEVSIAINFNLEIPAFFDRKKTIYVNSVRPDDKMLSTVIHELGHAGFNAFLQQNKESYLIYFIDEVEQAVRGGVYKEMQPGPVTDIKRHIQKELHQKHPTLGEKQLERATVLHLKRELVLLSLLPKEELSAVLDYFKKQQIIAPSLNQSDFSRENFETDIQDTKEFYTSFNSFYEGNTLLTPELKNKILKKHKSSLLLDSYFKNKGQTLSQGVLSNRFCQEMLGYTGFVSVQNTHLLRLNRIYFERMATGEFWLPENEKWTAFIDTTGLTKKEDLETISFYKKQGIVFKKEGNRLKLKDKLNLKKLAKIIYADYNEALVFQLKEGESAFINFVSPDNLNHKKQNFIHRWQNKGFNFKSEQINETVFKFDLTSANYTELALYLQTVQFAKNVIYGLPLTYERELPTPKNSTIKRVFSDIFKTPKR